MRYFAYILRSIADPTYYYKGHCEDLEARLKQHNSGMTKSNKHKRPFIIAHHEAFETLPEAIKREKYFKSALEGNISGKYWHRSSMPARTTEKNNIIIFYCVEFIGRSVGRG